MKLKGILKFYCLCKSGCCCHIIATIWMLDEYSRKNLVQATSSKSKTSKPQAWGIPNQKRKITHEPVMETKVVRPKHISDAVPQKTTRFKNNNHSFDPRPVGKQGLDINGLNEMSEKLKKNGLKYSICQNGSFHRKIQSHHNSSRSSCSEIIVWMYNWKKCPIAKLCLC